MDEQTEKNITTLHPKMDERTKKNIATLHPKAQKWAEAHMKAIVASGVLPSGYTVKIISGNRTYAEQNALYAKGRTALGPIVTNARGGWSNHNFGIAWDIGVFDDKGNYLPESPLYHKLGPVGEKLGLEWGGRWKSFPDTPHYQVSTGLSLAQLRQAMSNHTEFPVPNYDGGLNKSQSQPYRIQVSVVEGTKKLDLIAFLESGNVWVEIRKFVEHFGGGVASFLDNRFVFELNGERHTFSGTIVNSKGFVRFSDLNAMLGLDYSFKDYVLTIEEV